MKTLLVLPARDLLLLLARAHGAVYRWLRTGWRRAAIYALGLAEALWVADRAMRPDPPWMQAPTYLALAAVVGALFVVWEARSRLTIDEFAWAEPRVAQEKERPARGLATLLGVKVGTLARLYGPIDEERQIATAVGAQSGLRASVTVGAPSDVLRDTVSAETKLGLGPLQVPVGAVLSLAARLTQGPRITGTVYVEDGEASVIAALVGGPRPLTWRTSSVRLTPTSPPANTSASGASMHESGALDVLFDELALLVFTDLALAGQTRWRAVRCFTEGLRLYRESLRTPKDARLNRQRARQLFIESLAEDDAMSLVYYNLGVVHSDLAEDSASAGSASSATAGSGGSLAERDARRAEAAFRTAMERQPGRAEPYYALAAQLYRQGRDLEVVELCRRVVSLVRDHAEGYDLLGIAQGRLAGSAPADRDAIPAYRRALEDSARSSERAVALAWRAMLWAALRGVPTEVRTRALAFKAYRNLGMTYARLAEQAHGASAAIGFRRAVAVLERVPSLAPPPAELPAQLNNIFSWTADLHDRLGDIYSRWRKPSRAARCYGLASEIAPTNALYRAKHARALADAGQRERALAAATVVPRTSATLASLAPGSVWAELRRTYLTCRSTHEAARLHAMGAALREIDRLQFDGPALSAARERYGRSGKSWEAAQCAAVLGIRLSEEGKTDEAVAMLGEAVFELSIEAPDEIRERDLHRVLAATERQRKNHREALIANEAARRLDPFAIAPLNQRGEIYLDIADHRSAAAEWSQALLTNPDDAELHYNAGVAHWEMSRGLRGEPRREAVEKARAYLENARDLYPPEERGWVYYRLGQLNTEDGHYRSAVEALRTARALGATPLESGIWLAQAYIRERQFEDAESTARTVLREAEARLRADPLLLNAPVPEEERGERSGLARQLCYAAWVLAYSYAQRGIVDEGMKAIRMARNYASQVANADSRRSCEASCYDCTGFLQYQSGNYVAAQSALEAAVRRLADPEAYIHLGLVYAARRRDARKASAKAKLEALAIRCAERARELDPREEFTAERAGLDNVIRGAHDRLAATGP